MRYGLLQKMGIELEYMIVGSADLMPSPLAESLLDHRTGETDRGLWGWSKELTSHVIEIKNPKPVSDLKWLKASVMAEVQEINQRLLAHGARLLPTGAHPLFAPTPSNVVLWPHGQKEIYNLYNQIFDCTGHGWSNLQSTHINLSFDSDFEFEQLHGAIRLLLPLLPGLFASTPILEGKETGFLCSRLDCYRKNQSRIPEIAGDVVPEANLKSELEYKTQVLQSMYSAVSPFDPGGILQKEWLNSRGAIPKFEYGLIEIRVCDIQENPLADMDFAEFVVIILRRMIERGAHRIEVSQGELVRIYTDAVQRAESAEVSDRAYLSFFLGKESSPMTVQDLLEHIFEQWLTDDQRASIPSLENYFRNGSLATRMLTSSRRVGLKKTLSRLADCLRDGVVF